MPVNFRKYALDNSPPVLRTLPGRMFVGVKAMLYDFLVQAAVHATRAGWIGDSVGPSYDGIGPAGLDLHLPRYPGETFNAYHGRLQEAWTDWVRAGHEEIIIKNLAALGFPGGVVHYHTEWDGYPPPWWSLFSIFYAAGTHPFGVPRKYGDGAAFGDGTIYGVTGITALQLVTMRGIIRKFKPGHWVCVAVVFEMTPGGERVFLGMD